MVKEYQPRQDPLGINRVKLHMKNMIAKGKIIEEKAAKTYEFFKKLVDSEPGSDTDTSKKCMIDALKIEKEARQYSLKVFELCVKMFLAEGPIKKSGMPTSMEELLGDE